MHTARYRNSKWAKCLKPYAMIVDLSFQNDMHFHDASTLLGIIPTGFWNLAADIYISIHSATSTLVRHCWSVKVLTVTCNNLHSKKGFMVFRSGVCAGQSKSGHGLFMQIALCKESKACWSCWKLSVVYTIIVCWFTFKSRPKLKQVSGLWYLPPCSVAHKHKDTVISTVLSHCYISPYGFQHVKKSKV